MPIGTCMSTPSTGSFVQANYGAFSCVLHAMAAALPPGAATVTELHAGEQAHHLCTSRLWWFTCKTHSP